MATRKSGARLIAVDGVRYRWRIRHRATYLQMDYGDGSLTCTVELAETPGQTLILRTSHPHPKDWGAWCAIPFLPRDVACWVRRALEAGWQPAAEGSPFTLRAQTIETPADLPETVRTLAAALRAGDDCAFALHDALLEAGHPDLAEHFAARAHDRKCLLLELLSGATPSPS